ncbi:MAG: acyl carrier protein [Thermodesulfobacteriota bacterium]|nr:acyl carrier protein [Thermodesulfobacteriota bacterium]
MGKPEKMTIFNDILATLEKVGEDWEYSDEITMDTYLLGDLGLESIDVVVLGEFLEEHYDQSFPFTEYFTELAQQEIQDIRVSDLVDFLDRNFDGQSEVL